MKNGIEQSFGRVSSVRRGMGICNVELRSDSDWVFGVHGKGSVDKIVESA